MGIINVTPDSFSDGGRHETVSTAVKRAKDVESAGVDVIDVGGESTRPGSNPVSAEEQLHRVVPVIQAIRAQSTVPISIDTTQAVVAAAALDAGATIINDISAGTMDDQMLPLAARRGVPVILMHMQGRPATMQMNPVYEDVTAEVTTFLLKRAQSAEGHGIAKSDIMIDPGIGFGKTDSHNLMLLQQLNQLVATGFPVLIGASRKGFIGRITGESDPVDRVMGTAATTVWAAMAGAAAVRVHDVPETIRILKMTRAIREAAASEENLPVS